MTRANVRRSANPAPEIPKAQIAVQNLRHDLLTNPPPTHLPHTAMPKVPRPPSRNKVKPTDPWDLAPLCESDDQWEEMFQKLDKMIAGYAKFRGKLGESTKMLAVCLKFDSDFDRLGERVGGYAHLKATEDQANSTYQAMAARFPSLATRPAEAASNIRPV